MKTVIVTGAGDHTNIGGKVASFLYRKGWNVVAVDIKEDSAWHSGRYFESIVADCTDWEAMDEVFAHVREKFGDIHALVNSTGINLLGSIDTYTVEQFKATLAANLIAPFVSIQAFVKSCGYQKGSKMVVNIGSNTADIPRTKTFAYAASKCGLQAMTRCLARELAPREFYIVQLDLGVVAGTPMDVRTYDDLISQRGGTKEEWQKKRLANIPAGCFTDAYEVAHLVEFVLEHGSYFTGNCLRFDGAEQAGTFWSEGRQ